MNENDITITIDERFLLSICDAALKAGGINLINACNQVLASMQKAKQNGAGHIEIDEPRPRAN